VLEQLVAEVIDAMNAGATLDRSSRRCGGPSLLAAAVPAAVYDEPEFVVRNVWRLYGGWWDANPARLKPAADAAIGAEVVRLAAARRPSWRGRWRSLPAATPLACQPGRVRPRRRARRRRGRLGVP
jgi:hypothetical protein